MSPSALAVLRLITKLELVDCSTGRSAGFVPRRILSAYSAARRYMPEKFTPYETRPPTSTYSRNAKLVGNRLSFAKLRDLSAAAKDGRKLQRHNRFGTRPRGNAKRILEVIWRILQMQGLEL